MLGLRWWSLDSDTPSTAEVAEDTTDSMHRYRVIAASGGIFRPMEAWYLSFSFWLQPTVGRWAGGSVDEEFGEEFGRLKPTETAFTHNGGYPNSHLYKIGKRSDSNQNTVNIIGRIFKHVLTIISFTLGPTLYHSWRWGIFSPQREMFCPWGVLLSHAKMMDRWQWQIHFNTVHIIFWMPPPKHVMSMSRFSFFKVPSYFHHQLRLNYNWSYKSWIKAEIYIVIQIMPARD